MSVAGVAATQESIQRIDQAYARIVKAAETSRLREKIDSLLKGGAADTAHQRPRMVAVSRHLNDNNEIYAGFVNALVGLVLPKHGILPVAETDDEAMHEIAEAFCADFAAWARTANGRSRRGMGTGLHGSWRRCLESILRSGFVDGDVGVRWLEQMGVPPSLLIIEADRIGGEQSGHSIAGSWKIGEQDGKDITAPMADGVVYDEDTGAPLGYLVGDYDHLGNIVPSSAKFQPADTMMVFGFAPRDSSLRGEPPLRALIARLAQFDEYLAATVAAAMVQSLVAFALTSTSINKARAGLASNLPSWMGGAGGGGGGSSQWPAGSFQDGDAGTGDPDSLVDMPLGSIMHLEQGEDLKAVGSTQPSNTFDPFVNRMIRLLAGAVGVPVEVLLRDFSKASFSSGRMAWFMARATADPIVEMLISAIVEPTAAAYCTWKAANGKPEYARLLTEDGTLAHIRYMRPAAPVVDPEKEYAANRQALESGQMTLDEIHANNQRDWKAVIRQRGIEEAYIKQHGVTISITPGAAPTGVPIDRDDPPGREAPGDGPEATDD